MAATFSRRWPRNLPPGASPRSSWGRPTTSLVPSWVDEPSVEPRSVAGVVITMDHFGNLITNIDAALIERFRLPLVHAGNHAFRLLRTYGDTQPGEYLALVNSFGVIEIARAENSAAEGLGLVPRGAGDRPRPHRPALSVAPKGASFQAPRAPLRSGTQNMPNG